MKRVRCLSVMAFLLAGAAPAAAQQPERAWGPASDQAVTRLIADRAEIRAQKFTKFRRQQPSGDLAGPQQASDPVQVTGGLTNNDATAKIRVSKQFGAAFIIAGDGSVSGTGVKAIDLLDPAHFPADYSGKVTLSWTLWKNVLSNPAELRSKVCDAAARIGATASADGLVTQFKQSTVLDVPGGLILSASYEAGHITFAFADPANNYERATEGHKAQTLAGVGGYVFSHTDNQGHEFAYASVLATYKRYVGYVAGSTTTRFFCHPLAGTTASSCDTDALPDAPPRSKPADVVQVDARYYFPAWPISPGVRFTRDNVNSFDIFVVPTYFIRKEMTPYTLVGGVTAGYRDGGTAKGRFVALFFGAAVSKPQK